MVKDNANDRNNDAAQWSMIIKMMTAIFGDNSDDNDNDRNDAAQCSTIRRVGVSHGIRHFPDGAMFQEHLCCSFFIIVDLLMVNKWDRPFIGGQGSSKMP